MNRLCMFASILGAWAHPLEMGASSGGVAGGVKLLTSRMVTKADSLSSRFIDLNSTKWETQRVLNKYALASQFLQGIGLNPDTNAETGYPLFNDTAAWLNYTAAHVPAQNTTRLLSSDAIDSSDFTPRLSVLKIMPMTDYNDPGYDMLYYGHLQFGTPAQDLSVVVDTGSADLWVPSNCGTCNSPQFRAKASSTFSSTGDKFRVNYGIGQAVGKVVHDVVSMKNFRVQEQAFGAVSYESDNFYEYPSSGLLGLAFGSISSIDKPTFFENLLQTRQLEFAMFGIHLARNQQEGSEVCFGCVDFTKTTGRVSWFPLRSKTYWTVSLDGVSSGVNHSVSMDAVAAIDTGTSMIYLPDDVTAKFYASIAGARSAEKEYGEGYYFYPCSAKLAISLSFMEQKFNIRAEDFNMGKVAENETECLGGIVSLGYGFPSNLAIIGDAFLKSWYSIYDYTGARVGFAPSVNNQ